MLNSANGEIKLVQIDSATNRFSVLQQGNNTLGPQFDVNQTSQYSFDSSVILPQADIQQAFEDTGLTEDYENEQDIDDLIDDSPELAQDIVGEMNQDNNAIGPLNVPG